MKSPDGSKNVAVGAPIAVIAEEGDDLSAAEEFAKKAAEEKVESKKEEEKAPEPVELTPEQKRAAFDAQAPVWEGIVRTLPSTHLSRDEH